MSQAGGHLAARSTEKDSVLHVRFPHAKQGRLVAGAAGISAYCASKFAVRGFLDSLRLEARQHQPTNCCSMPFLPSPLL